jgi:hypothetical protein
VSRLRRRLRVLLVVVVVAGLVSVGLAWLAVRHIDHAVTRVPMALDARGGRPGDSPSLDVLLVLTAPPGGSGAPLDWAQAGPTASVMLVHVDADRRGLGMVALPDLVASGLAAQGPEQVAEAVEQTTGVHLDHVAVLRWSALADLIDAADGVVVELPGGVPGWEPGLRTLDPQEAWSFVRDYPGPEPGAEGEARRMQYLLRLVLEGTLHQEMARNPWQLVRFLDDVAHGLVVDTGWQLGEMRRDVWDLRHLRSFDIRFVVAPPGAPGSGRGDTDAAATLWNALRTDALDPWMGAHPGWETSRRL